jgi:hypothetical protein
MNNYYFNTKTYYAILTDKDNFKNVLQDDLSVEEKFIFSKKDLAIFFVIDESNCDLELYNNQELRYIDEFVNDYLNDVDNEIEFSREELKEFLAFSEEKKIPDDINYGIIKKFVELYNSETNDYLDISEIE